MGQVNSSASDRSGYSCANQISCYFKIIIFEIKQVIPGSSKKNSCQSRMK